MIYTVKCRRVGGWWAISVPRLKGVHSQARRLEKVEAMAREAIGLMLDVDPATVEVKVVPDVPEQVRKALRARREARDAERAAEQATRRAAAELIAAGYTVRDAGSLLELSPQRISQLAGHKAA